MISTTDLLALLSAIALAALGGEAFLKGVLGVAHALRLPKFLVATTLAAFATSSPELTVSSVAALSGAPEVGLGDALGSNVVNIAMIFGLALLFGPIRSTRGELRRDFGMALLVPLLTLFLAADGTLSRFDGGLLLCLFIGWVLVTIRAGMVARNNGEHAESGVVLWKKLLYCLGGLLALILAGRLFVSGATGIAIAFGIDAFVVGVTVVAIGTSLPELVTVLLARWRGHDDIGVGTLLGSNLFNGLAIVGIAAVLHPITISVAEIAITIGFGVCAVLLILPKREGFIPRSRGFAMLGAYVAFVCLMLLAGRAISL
jgi:cation:H+ antiporter